MRGGASGTWIARPIETDGLHQRHVATPADVARHDQPHSLRGERLTVLSYGKQDRLIPERGIELAPGDDGLVVVGGGGRDVEAELVVLDLGIELRLQEIEHVVQEESREG
jgi:hypothetical protein